LNQKIPECLICFAKKENEKAEDYIGLVCYLSEDNLSSFYKFDNYLYNKVDVTENN